MARSWYPMLAAPPPSGVLVFDEASMWDERGIAHVRAGLAHMGSCRVTELREYGADYLVDIEMFAPRCTGAEGVWSDDTLTWIAFASHEGTVAFGGRLAAALKAGWADLANDAGLPEYDAQLRDEGIRPGPRSGAAGRPFS